MGIVQKYRRVVSEGELLDDEPAGAWLSRTVEESGEEGSGCWLYLFAGDEKVLSIQFICLPDSKGALLCFNAGNERYVQFNEEAGAIDYDPGVGFVIPNGAVCSLEDAAGFLSKNEANIEEVMSATSFIGIDEVDYDNADDYEW